MIRNTYMLFLALIGVVTACSRPATKEEVVGLYTMNKGKASDTLRVYPNGAYARRYAAPGVASVVDSGRWTWDTVNGAQFLTLEKFIPRWDDELFPPTRAAPGFWPARPERTIRGSVTIPVERDLGWAYVQVRH
jgi:hypothetical protein